MEPIGRILIIPSWYPPDGGYFFKEHSEAIRENGMGGGCAGEPGGGGPETVSGGTEGPQRIRCGQENGLRVVRAVYLKIPGRERLNIRQVVTAYTETF